MALKGTKVSTLETIKEPAETDAVVCASTGSDTVKKTTLATIGKFLLDKMGISSTLGEVLGTGESTDIATKTVSSLTSDSTLSETDAFVYGDAGGNTLKKSALSVLRNALFGATTLPSALATTAKNVIGAINELNTNLTAAVAKNANSTKFYMGIYLYSGTSTNNVTIYIPSGYSAAIATAQNSGGIYVTYVSVSGTTMVINLSSATMLIQLNYILI